MNGYSMNMKNEKEPNVKKLLPTGWREFEIVDCVPETSKKGNAMFVFHIRDLATDYVDRVYAIATEGKRWTLKSILTCCGVESGQDGIYNWDFNSVMNKNILGYVEHEQNVYIDRAGETINTQQHKITKFKKVGDIVPIEPSVVSNPDGVKTPADIKWTE